MKHLLTCLWVSCALCTTAMSQTLDGTYTHTWENAEGALTYTLTLTDNGTFTFESVRTYLLRSTPTKKSLVKGTWEQNRRMVILNTEPSETDDDLAKKLDDVKARYIDYSPRHHQYGILKPSLEFYQCELFFAKGMALELKDMEVVTASKTVATDPED